jgi:hypothetical protein
VGAEVALVEMFFAAGSRVAMSIVPGNSFQISIGLRLM